LNFAFIFRKDRLPIIFFEDIPVNPKDKNKLFSASFSHENRLLAWSNSSLSVYGDSSQRCTVGGAIMEITSDNPAKRADQSASATKK
jgi:hypothetical protein